MAEKWLKLMANFSPFSPYGPFPGPSPAVGGGAVEALTPLTALTPAAAAQPQMRVMSSSVTAFRSSGVRCAVRASAMVSGESVAIMMRGCPVGDGP